MTWGSVWGGYLFARHGVIVIIFPVHPLTWRRFQRHCRGVFFVFPLFCGGSCVCSTLLSFTGGVDSSCRTVMLYISANFFSVAVYFSPRCGMGLDGGGL